MLFSSIIVGGTSSSSTLENKYQCFDNKPIKIQVLYTTTINKSFERVFQYGNLFYITTVIQNLVNKTIKMPKESIRLSIKNDKHAIVYNATNKVNYTIEPKGYLTLRFKWNCSHKLATWKEAGYKFTGKKFTAEISTYNKSKTHGFYIDEFGIPKWIRNSIFFDAPRSLPDTPKDEITKKTVEKTL